MSLFACTLRLYRHHCRVHAVTVPFAQLGDDARRPWYQLARQRRYRQPRKHVRHTPTLQQSDFIP